MLRVFRPNCSQAADIEIAADAALPSDGVWIDLVDPTAEEERLVERTLGLQVPTRDEMAEIEPSSRLYQEGGAVFLTASVMSGIDAGDPVTRPSPSF